MIGFAICGLTDKLWIAKKFRSVKFNNYCLKPEKNYYLKVEVMLGCLFETKDKGEIARDTEKNLKSILCINKFCSL